MPISSSCSLVCLIHSEAEASKQARLAVCHGLYKTSVQWLRSIFINVWRDILKPKGSGDHVGNTDSNRPLWQFLDKLEVELVTRQWHCANLSVKSAGIFYLCYKYSQIVFGKNIFRQPYPFYKCVRLGHHFLFKFTKFFWRWKVCVQTLITCLKCSLQFALLSTLRIHSHVKLSHALLTYH